MRVAIPDIEPHLVHGPAVGPVPFDALDATWSLRCQLSNGIGHGRRETVEKDAGHAA